MDSYVSDAGGIPDTADALWSSLGLGDLLGAKLSPLRENILSDLGENNLQKKFKKKLQKPTYNAVIQRYEALPHNPRVLSKQSLNRLSDPIKLRASLTNPNPTYPNPTYPNP